LFLSKIDHFSQSINKQKSPPVGGLFYAN